MFVLNYTPLSCTIQTRAAYTRLLLFDEGPHTIEVSLNEHGGEEIPLLSNTVTLYKYVPKILESEFEPQMSS